MKCFEPLACVLLVFATPSFAQLIDPSANRQSQFLYVGIGFDQALINSTVGYGRIISVGLSDRKLALSAEINIPPTQYGLHNRRYRVGVQSNLFETGHFILPLKLESSLGYARNQAYDAINLSSAMTLTPAVKTGRLTVGIEGYYNHGWATRLTHRSAYLANYPAAQDGWYGRPSNTFRGGVALGYAFRRSELTSRVGYQQNGQFDTYLPPYYGLVGFIQHFGK